TWSGLLGGVMTAAVVAYCTAQIVGSAHAWTVFLLGAILAIVSQAGDLAESALKRRNGVKDASSLIPGHGGFMDRVDGLIFAAVAAAVWAYAVNPAAPGVALLALAQTQP
ncbi:MAG: phosphatidate cytidylyltransferase, partial [Hyphomicrobiaceae bacterium]